MSRERITHMKREDFITRMRADREAFAALWHGLTDQQMTQRPGPQEDWSVKDLIAHITWYEQYIAQRIEALLAGEDHPPLGDFDAVNAVIFEENKDRPLADVLAEFDASPARVEKAVLALNEAQFNEGGAYTVDGVTVLQYAIGSTFGHLNDHIADLRRHVDGLR
ncbi:MAG: DinB family protein [Chloroflexota bacterium]